MTSVPARTLLRPVMPELDTLRGIAVLAVVFLHGFYWQYSALRVATPARLFIAATQPGWMGVNLFFVLSGFLITGILLDSKTNPYYYRRFYGRRALRILPAYCLLLIVLGLAGYASLPYLGLSLVFLANVTPLFGVSLAYAPLWSLAVEEHFYLGWPAVVHRVGPRALAWIAAAICAAMPITRATAFTLGFTDGLGSFTWFVLDGLATGGLIAMLLRTGVSRAAVTRVCIGLIACALALAALGAPFGILTHRRLLGIAFQHTLISALFGGVLLAFLLVGTSRWKRLVNRPVLMFFGYISYGLYLIHLLAFMLYDDTVAQRWPALLPVDDAFELVVLKFVCAGGVAVGAAYLSRRYFENRFLALKGKLEPSARPPAPAAAPGAVAG